MMRARAVLSKPDQSGWLWRTPRSFMFLCGLILLCLNFGGKALVAQSWNQLNFKHLSLEKGLSQGTVNCLVQDRHGYLWIGTEDGLNRYDAYDFQVFRHNPQDSSSISNSFITALHEDSRGNLWIGTLRGGVNRYDRKAHRFIRYQHSEDEEGSLGSNEVHCLFEDSKGQLWVGTTGGLSRFDTISEEFMTYRNVVGERNSLSSNFVTSMAEDAEGNLWVGTLYAGLNRLDPTTGNFERFEYNRRDTSGIITNHVRSLLYDSNRRLWIGTESGLLEYKEQSGTFDIYTNQELHTNRISNDVVNVIAEVEPGILWIGTANGLNRFAYDEVEPWKGYFRNENEVHSLSNNHILSILKDNNGSLWFGTNGEGLNVMDEYSQKFMNYRSVIGKPKTIRTDNVRAIMEDMDGQVWIGTRGGGITVFDYNLRHIQHLDKSPEEGGLSSRQVSCIYQTRNGMVWIGTEQDGLNRLNPKTGEIKTFKHSRTSSNSLSHNGVLCVFEQVDGTLWVGTQSGGLNRFNPSTETFTHYKNNGHNPFSLSHNQVNVIMEDALGRLWVGTSGGLNRFNSETDRFTQIRNNPNDPYSISDDVIKCLFQDLKGRLWIGTRGGLNLYNDTTKQFKYYRTMQGLANDVVYGILQDNSGYLWLSTNQGLSKFDPSKESFRNYSAFDGLQGNEFNTGAYARVADGRMFFGGLNGFNVFYADSVFDNEFVPPIMLTDFRLFNESVLPGTSDILKEQIDVAESVTLKHSQSVFSISFAALNYTWPEKNEYAYKLEGFVDEWTPLGNQRFVTFTNLDPGTYVFRVKGSNNDGKWNETGKSLTIHILPAYYQTIWFRLLVIFGILLLVYLFYRTRVGNIKNLNKQLEFKVNERTAQILKEKEAKEVLLKEIHHRVKNNLQVITSLLRLQSHRVEDEGVLSLFLESQNRIISMALIHEKMYESHDLAHINIGEYFEQLTRNLIDNYRLNQSINLDIDVHVSDLGLDTLTPLGLIVNEIISNSLKYAFTDRSEGKITLHLSRDPDRRLRLLIGDDGIGLPSGIDFENPDSLGIELMQTLTDQMDGTLTLLADRPGTMYEIVLEDRIRPIN